MASRGDAGVEVTSCWTLRERGLAAGWGQAVLWGWRAARILSTWVPWVRMASWRASPVTPNSLDQ